MKKRPTTLGTDRRIPESNCWHCGRANDAAFGVNNDATPEPGDVTVCMACFEVNAYGDDLQLRRPTDEEYIDIANNPDVKTARELLARAKAGYEREHGPDTWCVKPQ